MMALLVLPTMDDRMPLVSDHPALYWSTLNAIPVQAMATTLRQLSQLPGTFTFQIKIMGRRNTHVTPHSGESIVIHTFPYYIQNAVTALQAKGAIPIVSSQTPSNYWTGSSISAGPRFVDYAKTAASRTKAQYIDHYAYVAQSYNKLGQTTVTTYFPNDNTHTLPVAANIVAQSFVRGLLCSSSPLKNSVNSAGKAVPSTYTLVLF